VASNKTHEGGSTCSKGAQSHAVQTAVRAVLPLPLLPARDLGRPLDATIVANRIGCSTAVTPRTSPPPWQRIGWSGC